MYKRLEPTNLELVDDDKKTGIVGRFNGIFANENLAIVNLKEIVNERIQFTTYNTYTNAESYIPVDFRSVEKDTPPVLEEFDRYLIVGNDLNYSKVTNYKYLVKKVLGKLPRNPPIRDGCKFATSLIVYDLPDMVEVGSCFHPSLNYDIASLVVKRIDPNDRALNAYEKVLEAVVDGGNRNSNNYANANKLQNIRMLREGLVKSKRYMHNWDAIYTFFGSTIVELDAKVNEFKKQMYRFGVKIDHPKFVQRILYENRRSSLDAKNYTFLSNDTTLDTFYPFSSMELIETGKRAVLLGRNLQTGSPIIYNRDNRKLNYHIVIVGTTGSGKSLLTKVFVVRLVEEVEQDFPVVIIGADPSVTREYRAMAERLGIEYKTLDEGIGIDPLHYDAPVATSILSKLFKLSKEQEDKLFKIIEKVQLRKGTVEDIESEIKAHLGDNKEDDIENELLNAVHHGMKKYGYIFKGTFPTKSFIVSTYSYDNDAIIATSTLVMLRTKEYFNELPLNTAKFLIVDEGWKLMEDKNSSEILAVFSREGRKSNISLIFIVQDPKDILENRLGQTILNNCDTKILMQTDASAELKQVLSLSTIEENLIKTNVEKNEPGIGLMIAGYRHVHFKAEPTPEELVTFTTKATTS